MFSIPSYLSSNYYIYII